MKRGFNVFTANFAGKCVGLKEKIKGWTGGNEMEIAGKLVHLMMLSARFGQDSSVGMATCYRMGGPGIESQWGRDFPHLS